MSDCVFEKLKINAHSVDNGLKMLEKKWESPQNLLCPCDKNIEEAKTLFTDFITPIVKIRDEIIGDIGPRSDYLKDMNRFLTECTIACDELKQEVDDLEILFSEFGYIKPDDINSNHNGNDNDENNEDNVNSSILNSEEMKNLTINSSFNDHSNNESSNLSSIHNNVNDYPPKYIATPVIKSVGSVIQT